MSALSAEATGSTVGAGSAVTAFNAVIGVIAVAAAQPVQ